MKKNLTLLMMLAAFVSILSAQSGPKFNYQAVVRNADTLVYNQDMTVTITVTDGTHSYSETHANVTSTKNGLVSVVIGDGTVNSGNLAQIDWSKSNTTITAKFAFNSLELTSTIPVTPVPYAIYAGGTPLTTEIIANYMKNTLTTQDAHDILDALVIHNNPLLQDIEDTIEVYLKAHKDIAIDVAKAYIDSLKASHVQEFYDALDGNTTAKDKLKQLIKQYAIDNRDMVKDLVIWYLKNATLYDIQRAYATVQDMPEATKQAFRDYLADYVKKPENRTIVYNFGTWLIQNVTKEEANQAYSYLKFANQNGVNDHLREILNFYINKYLTEHPEATDLDLDTAVDHAIDNYVQSHHLIPTPSCTIDFCTLQHLYDEVNQ